MKRTLCLRFPNWPIERIVLQRPELRDKPVVLYETRRGGRCVVACSAAAQALGAIVDMPVAEVTAMAGAAQAAS